MKNLESPSIFSENSPPELSDNEQENQGQKILIEQNVEMIPPDGGWGWMVVGGSFLIMVIGTFPSYAFSILLSPILMSHGVSSIKIFWLFNLIQLILSFYVIFIGPLCEQFGTRKVAIFGGISNFLSLFLSAFAPTPDYLFLTFAVPAGIGGASTFPLCSIVVSSYFKKYRGLALGITSVGGCLSIFISPVVSNYLLENYGYTCATLISAAFVLNQCVGASFFQPVNWHIKSAKTCLVAEKTLKDQVESNEKSEETILLERVQIKSYKKAHSSRKNTENKRYTDKLTLRNHEPGNKIMNILQSTYKSIKTLRYMRVHLISWSYFVLSFGFTNFLMLVPFVMTSKGYSLETTAWCSSLSSFGNLVGRISMSLLADRKFFNVIYGLMFGELLMGFCIIAFSLAQDITFFMIIICCHGFGAGFSISLNVTVMIKVMGIEMFPSIIGICSLYKGLAGIIIGPLIGAIRDVTQNYSYCLWIIGGLQFMGFLMLLLIPFGERFDNWNMRRMERKNKHEMVASCINRADKEKKNTKNEEKNV